MAQTDDDQRLLDSIQLAMVPGVGPHTSQALLERFGSAGRVLAASRGALMEVAGVGPKIAENISRARQDFDAAACQSSFIVFDALNVARGPVARLRLPGAIPFGFQASFNRAFCRSKRQTES